MRQAAELLQSVAGVDAAVKAAELMTDLVEHENEATLFTFDDDSVLLVLGQQMTAHDDIGAPPPPIRPLLRPKPPHAHPPPDPGKPEN